MASIRKVKHELHKAIDSVIEDCFLYLYLFPEREADFLAIIEESVSLQNSAIKGFNAVPDSKEKRHGYYARLRKEVRSQITALVDRLCTISDSKK